MIARLVFAVAVGIGTALACLLLGLILSAIGVPIVTTIGDFLSRWAWVIGAVAGLISFVSGRVWPPTVPS